MFGLTHHDRRRRIRGFGYFRRLGPGFITGAADDDPSGIGTYSQVGASFGYGLAWTAVFSLPLAIAVQEASARLGLVTGKGLSTLIRERYPRPVLYAAVFLVAVANTFNLGADLGAMAAAIRLIIPVPFFLGIVAFAAVMLALEFSLPYHRYSKVLRWLCLSLGAYLLVVIVVRVDWIAVLRETIFPSLTSNRAYFVALTAIFGTTITPYLFFWQSSEEVEEQSDTDKAGTVAMVHVDAMRVDVVGGMASGIVVMFAIVVASAATLGAQGITDVQSAVDAAIALRPIAGDFAALVFALGIIGTGLLAVPVLAGSTAYALSDAFRWREGLSRKPRDAPGFYGTIAAGMVAGLVMNFAGLDPIRALYWAAILNGIAAPPLMILIWLLARSEQVLGDQKSGRLSQATLGLAIVVMIVAPAAVILSG